MRTRSQAAGRTAVILAAIAVAEALHAAGGGPAPLDGPRAAAIARPAVEPLRTTGGSRAATTDGRISPAVAPLRHARRTSGVPRRLEVAPYRATITGRGAPSGTLPVTITVRSPDGTPRGQRATRADRDGAFAVGWFTDARRMRPGDVIEVDLGEGDPVTLVIPTVTARTEPDADRVSGTAPPGAIVEVVPRRPRAPTVTTPADGGGGYAAVFAGLADLDLDASGEVRVALAGGHRILVDWSAIRVRMNLGGPLSATVTGARGQPVRVVLVDGDGHPVAMTDEPPDPGAAPDDPHRTLRAGIAPRDALGQRVAAEAADGLWVTVGDDAVRLTVPRLDGTVSLDDDRVDVRSDPGRRVSITVVSDPPTGAPPPSVEVVADARGEARHAFAGVVDIRFQDRVVVETSIAGHVAARSIYLAGLSLDLDASRLQGVWPEPNQPLRVSMEPDGGTPVVRDTVSGHDGRFAADVRGPDGHGGPAPGGRIRVHALADPGRGIGLVVPELTLAADAERDRVDGRATPGGDLRLTLADDRGDRKAPHDQAAGAVVPIAADGSWSADLRPAFDIRAGTLIQAAYRTAEGHTVSRSRRVAWLNVQHGGAAVCGHGPPLSVTTAVLRDAAARIRATGVTRTDADGRFSLILADALGRPVATRAGDTVIAAIGPEAVRQVVPMLTVDVDWAGMAVTGRADPGAELVLRRPAGNCGDTPWSVTTALAIDSDGAFHVSTASASPGDGVEIGVFGADGHRAYRPIVRPRIRVWTGASRIDGRAAALSDVRAVLWRGGQVIAAADATADAAGHYRLTPRDADGATAAPRDGDAVEVTASGARETVEIEPLSLDWSAGDGITIGTTPRRVVEIELRLRDGRSIWLAAVADGAGAYRLRPDDVPPRSTWSLSDITGVRASTDAARGPDGGPHTLMTTAGAPGIPDPYDPNPQPLPGRALLPWAGLRAPPARR